MPEVQGLLCTRASWEYGIKKTSPCNIYPLKPNFYTVNWSLQGYTYFLIFAQKHRLRVLVRTAHNLCFEQI